MSGSEYHVSPEHTTNAGTREAPVDTIAAAAERAYPGDTIVVHEGVYRERIDPPRGGTSASERIEYRAAEGEVVEIRGSEVVEGWKQDRDGLWRLSVPNSFFGEHNPFAETIDGHWFEGQGREHHRGMVFCDGEAVTEAESVDTLRDIESSDQAWNATIDDAETTILARFGSVNPNDVVTEITVRPAVVYPREPGIDYIAIGGFRLRHAATQWPAPTNEQIGLVGSHWSKGWLIEDNEISHSRCAGITLGCDGDWRSEPRWEGSWNGYNEAIRDAIDRGWERDTIGHHTVRNNVVHNCGTGGIIGSMGGAFSTIRGNRIFDIHRQESFDGAEIAGIKFHGAIDTEILDNEVCRSTRGIWLDWMTQGTRVSRNLVCGTSDFDLFLEVNHGPFVVDNNILLSDRALWDRSEGGAYAHNLFAGEIDFQPELERSTPYHKPRSTAIAGCREIVGGDNSFYNNVIVGGEGLATYQDADQSVSTGGNVFHDEATPPEWETGVSILESGDQITISETEEGQLISIRVHPRWQEAETTCVTTKFLGSAAVPDAPFTEPDGTTLRIDRDYFGNPRAGDDPSPGPFEDHDVTEESIDIRTR